MHFIWMIFGISDWRQYRSNHYLRTENIGVITLTRSCRNLLCIIMLRKFVGSVVCGSGIGWSNVSFHTKIFYHMSWFEFTTLVYWPCDAVNLCTSPFETEPWIASSSRLLRLTVSPWTGDVPAMTVSLCSTYYNCRVWFRKWSEARSEALLAWLTTKASSGRREPERSRLACCHQSKRRSE